MSLTSKPSLRKAHPESRTGIAVTLLASVSFRVPDLILAPVVNFLALLLTPWTIPRFVREDRAFRLLTGTFGLAIAYGLFMSLAKADLTSQHLVVAATVVFWLSCFVALPAFALMLAEPGRSLAKSVLIVASGGVVSMVWIQSDLSWKGSLGTYATIVLIALLALRRAARVLVVGALLLSALISAAADARSMAAFALSAAVFVLLPSRLVSAFTRKPLRSTAFVLMGGLIVAMGVYRALLSGLLGDEAQIRTQIQATYGNPLIVGRVELAAASAVFEASPLGFWPGARADGRVQSAGIGEIAALGGDFSNPYFLNEMFGDRHDFHSTFVNLWFHFGIAGIAVGGMLAFIIARSLGQSAGMRPSERALVAYVAAVALWDMLFSPMESAHRIAFAVFVAAMVIRVGSRHSRRVGESRELAGLGRQHKFDSARNPL